MKTKNKLYQAGIGLLVGVAAMPGAMAADAGDDAQARIERLEKQVQMLTEQLQALRESPNVDSPQALSVSRPVTTDAGGQDNTVRASFKEGLVFSDGSGNWSLRPYLRLQMDARHYVPDAFAADTFSLRRARLGMIGTFLKDFVVRIEGEYAEGNTRLNDGYLEFNRWKSANLRLGQIKPYYGLERAMGAMDLNFMERAISDNLAGSVFDRGVMVHGEPFPGLYYSAAYVNGTGQNADETDKDAKHDSKDVSFRVTGNVAQWLGWKDSVAHFGGWAAYGEQGAGSAIPVLRTEGRGVTFFSTTATTKDTFNTTVDRTRYGLETALAYNAVKFQGEYFHTGFEGIGFDRDMSAWYASMQWLVTGERYADMYKKSVFGKVLPKHNFDGTDGWGALELGLRYSSFDAGDFVTGNASGTGKLAAGYTNKADAWTLGAKWILNPYAMLLMNYVHTGFDTPVLVNGKADDSEDALNMRIQFDF